MKSAIKPVSKKSVPVVEQKKGSSILQKKTTPTLETKKTALIAEQKKTIPVTEAKKTFSATAEKKTTLAIKPKKVTPEIEPKTMIPATESKITSEPNAIRKMTTEKSTDKIALSKEEVKSKKSTKSKISFPIMRRVAVQSKNEKWMVPENVVEGSPQSAIKDRTATSPSFSKTSAVTNKSMVNSSLVNVKKEKVIRAYGDVPVIEEVGAVGVIPPKHHKETVLSYHDRKYRNKTRCLIIFGFIVFFTIVVLIVVIIFLNN